MNIYYKNEAPDFSLQFNNKTIENTLSRTNAAPVLYQQFKGLNEYAPKESQWTYIPVDLKALKRTNIIKIENIDQKDIIWGNYQSKKNWLPSYIYYKTFIYIPNMKYFDKTKVSSKVGIFLIRKYVAIPQKMAIGVAKK